MPEFLKVAKSADVEEGKGLIVWAGTVKVALFRSGGALFAIRNQCPHMGGDLGEGDLRGEIVRCPWHGWKFSIRTGKMPETEVVGVRTFEVRVDGEDVYVGV